LMRDFTNWRDDFDAKVTKVELARGLGVALPMATLDDAMHQDDEAVELEVKEEMEAKEVT